MELRELEAELRAIIVPYEDTLAAAEIYHMEVLRSPHAKSHDWFAGVRSGDGAVKFMLLPIHQHPELLEGISPALRKRRTGASVFTFRAQDSGLLPELEQLVARSFDAYVGTPPGKES